MLQLRFKPEIHAFDTCREFAEAFAITDEDLIFTNRYLDEPFFQKLHLPARRVYQEEFGPGEPTDLMVEALLEVLDALPCRRLIAVGGGTILDIAKILAVAPPPSPGTTDRTRVDTLYRDMTTLRARRELILVPTTCGTGSEVTPIAILNRTALGTKAGLVADAMYARHAVLIPELLTGLPYGVFATSSLDALVHAVESDLSPRATPFTRLFSRKAMQLIIPAYRHIQRHGPEARMALLKDFLFASTFAGLAFGTAGCAAVHALSYPLGGTYHVPHGESNYALFGEVLKTYRRIGDAPALEDLSGFLAPFLDCRPAQVLDELEESLAAILPLKQLREYGMTEEDIPIFTRHVLATQQRLLANNCRPLSEAQIREIYRARL